MGGGECGRDVIRWDVGGGEVAAGVGAVVFPGKMGWKCV